MHRFQSLKQAKQAGFTLIELIIVIVIIGILAAVAIPKYTDLTGDANKAAANGIAGAFASAAATNYAICSGGLAGCVAAVDCNDATLAALVDGAGGATTSGTAAACVVTLNSVGSDSVVIKTTP